MPIPSNENNKLTNISVKDIVYDKISEWIITGVLKPGEKISVEELAEHFNVSRTPVREAFQLMETQKLIKTMPRKATVVTDLDLEDINSCYQPIIVLEELAAIEACKRVKKSDIKKLINLNDNIKEYSDTGEIINEMIEDRKFHDSIVELSENRYIVQCLDNLQMQTSRFEYIEFMERGNISESIKQHTRIIAALKSKDELAAGSIMKEHWLAAQARLEKRIEEKSK